VNETMVSKVAADPDFLPLPTTNKSDPLTGLRPSPVGRDRVYADSKPFRDVLPTEQANRNANIVRM